MRQNVNDYSLNPAKKKKNILDEAKGIFHKENEDDPGLSINHYCATDYVRIFNQNVF